MNKNIKLYWILFFFFIQSCENNNYGRLIIILIEQRSIIWNKNKNIRAKIKIIESVKKKPHFVSINASKFSLKKIYQSSYPLYRIQNAFHRRFYSMMHARKLLPPPRKSTGKSNFVITGTSTVLHRCSKFLYVCCKWSMRCDMKWYLNVLAKFSSYFLHGMFEWRR